MKKLTIREIQKKYAWKYVDFARCPDWDRNEKWENLYEVRKSYSTIHENTCRAEDIETQYAFTR